MGRVAQVRLLTDSNPQDGCPVQAKLERGFSSTNDDVTKRVPGAGGPSGLPLAGWGFSSGRQTMSAATTPQPACGRQSEAQRFNAG
jgi:hypothetical protein